MLQGPQESFTGTLFGPWARGRISLSLVGIDFLFARPNKSLFERECNSQYFYFNQHLVNIAKKSILSLSGQNLSTTFLIFFA